MTLLNHKRILTINRGSGTLKSALYEVGCPEQLLLSMAVDQEGVSGARLKIADGAGNTLLDSTVDGGNTNAALEAILTWTSEHGFLSQLAAVGHRIVHGGPKYSEPQRITAEFLSDIQGLITLDPEHMPSAIRGIRFLAGKFPDLPQIACFDTAFHSSLPKVARMYALPHALYDQGIHRYGFHGLSYEYVMRELHTLEGNLAGGRVIIAHLGNGASMVAVKDGKSVDTSMGFTPTEGLVMSTRSGDVDPGVLLYLFQDKKMNAEQVNTLVNEESGLLGVSGTSGDMRVLYDKLSHDARAAEAVDLFCYRAKKYIGAYAAVLGGVDALVFTGGIGEHAPDVRRRICGGLDFLGIRVDAIANQANAALISSPESPVKVRVVRTNEDLMIVRHVLSALGLTNG